MKKVILALLIVAMISVSCFSLMACNSGVAVGFQNATTGKDYVESFSNLTAKGYSSAGLAVQDMINGRIKYVVTDKAVAKELVKAYSDKVKLIDINLTKEKYAFAVKNGNDELLAKVNEFLANNSDEVQAIIEGYTNGTITPKKFTNGDKNASNTLIVATNAEFDPFEYMDGGAFSGIDMEIMAMFCEEYGYTMYVENMAFEAVVTSIQTDKADIAAAALTVTIARAEQVSFSDAYFLDDGEDASQVIIAPIADTTFDNCKTKEDVEAIIKNL